MNQLAYYVPAPLRDEVPTSRIPPLVMEDVQEYAEGEPPMTSEAIRIVRTTQTTTPPPTPAQPEKTDPTITIMWIGAIAAVGGLSLEILKYLREK